MAVQNFGTGGGGFQLSPGVNVSEIDLTTIAPSVDTTAGAIAGVFRWGPVGQRVLVTSENDLVNKFGKPSDINAETWFTAANFLSYSSALYVSRAANTTAQFAAIGTTDTGIAPSSNFTIYNSDEFETKESNFGGNSPNYIARWAGELGNTLKVSVCENAQQYSSSVNLNSSNTFSVISYSVETANTTSGANTIGINYSNGDVLTFSGTGWNTNAQITVTTNGLGNVATISISNNGLYFGTLPTNPLSQTSVANSTGGASSGTGATFIFGYLPIVTPGSFTGQMLINVGSSTANVVLSNTAALPAQSNALPYVDNIPRRLQVGDYITVGSGPTQSLKIL